MTKFTPSELKVMKILWDHGELKPAEIQVHYEPPIKNPALRSFLTVLLEKGHLSRRLVGKAYHYKAVTQRSATVKRSLREVVDQFFDGSTDALMMSLIKSEKLDQDDLLELQRMANAPKKKSESKTKLPQKRSPKK